MNKKYLIVIGGPTASGKTRVAMDVARHFNTCILSADSRQFYREMNIGTAKPTAAELREAPHHFIDSLSIQDTYSVGDYERDAINLLQALFDQNQVVVLTGGSGLFIKAVCEGLDNFPEVPPEIMQQLEADFAAGGLAFLQKELQERDPAYYAEVDLQNPQRLLRALSVCRVSGQPFSSFRSQRKARRFFTPIYILLDWEREKLYERINLRVDYMMENGQLEEARTLFPLRHLNALQTVGYQELFDHFAGKTTLEEAVNMIKQNTRRYAKRQMTWFRRDDHWNHFSATGVAPIIEFIQRSIR